MRFLRRFLNAHRALVVSVGAISLYSATLAFAVQVAPGTVLDPAGLPGAYTVGPVLSYGEVATAGHDNQVLYLNDNGELVSDSYFVRDALTGDMLISKNINADEYAGFSLGDLGIGQGATLSKGNDATQITAFVGAVDGSFATFSDTVGMMIASDDLAQLFAVSIVVPTGRAVMYSGDTVSTFSSFEANADGYLEIKAINNAGVISAKHSFDSTGIVQEWDVNVANPIIDTISQGEALATIFKGNMIQHKNATTGENATILAVDGTAGGLRPFIAGLSYTNATVPTKIVQITIDDQKVRSRYFDNALDVEAELYQDAEGNSLTWDADTGDDIVNLIAQSDDLEGLGIKGSLLIHKNTSTGEAASVLAGDTTTGGGRFASVSLTSTDNTAGDTLANITLSHNDGVQIQYDETILSNRVSMITLNPNGLGLSFNGDITDDIIDQIMMTPDVGGFGVLDGIGILRTDSNLNVNTGLFVGDASGLGLSTMTSYLSAGSLLAAVDQNKFYAGDLLAMGNGTMMQVNDSNQKIKFNTGGQFIVVDSNDRGLFEIDAATFYFQLGDIDSGGNGTLFTVDDANQIATIAAAGSSGAVFAVTNADGTCTLDPGDVSGLACPSDENLKKEITTLQDGALSNILALRPVTYRLKKETEASPLSTGLIAQEVQVVFPSLVKTQIDGTLSLNYGGLTPFIVKAIQELNMKVTTIADLTEESGIREALRTWLSDTANGITELFAGRIKTNELCVGSVCVTESEFLQLVQQSGQNQTSFSGGTSVEEGSTSGTETNTDTGESGTETPEAPSGGDSEQTSTPENPPAPEPTETI